MVLTGWNMTQEDAEKHGRDFHVGSKTSQDVVYDVLQTNSPITPNKYKNKIITMNSIPS